MFAANLNFLEVKNVISQLKTLSELDCTSKITEYAIKAKCFVNGV